MEYYILGKLTEPFSLVIRMAPKDRNNGIYSLTFGLDKAAVSGKPHEMWLVAANIDVEDYQIEAHISEWLTDITRRLKDLGYPFAIQLIQVLRQDDDGSISEPQTIETPTLAHAFDAVWFDVAKAA